MTRLVKIVYRFGSSKLWLDSLVCPEIKMAHVILTLAANASYLAPATGYTALTSVLQLELNIGRWN